MPVVTRAYCEFSEEEFFFCLSLMLDAWTTRERAFAADGSTVARGGGAAAASSSSEEA